MSQNAPDHFRGPSVHVVVAAAAGGAFFSATVDVQAAEFQAENITFENSYGIGSQAVALAIHSGRAILRRCRFLGWQDTCYTASGRQYHQDCYIAGHVDFIFGNATAYFDHCEIHSRSPDYITAQSRLTPNSPTGYVFSDCRLTGQNTGAGVFLGRPWRPYARVVYLNCWMGSDIRPRGWDNWRSPANEKTAWFAEFESTGPGGRSDARAPWAQKLTLPRPPPSSPERSSAETTAGIRFKSRCADDNRGGPGLDTSSRCHS